jgi:hypothetical protein
MQSHRTFADTWEHFITLLTAQSPQLLEHIRPPATQETVTVAEHRLHCTLPQELRHLYALADGFREEAYLLRDDFRLLPLSELAEANLTLVGEPIILDVLAGDVSVAKSIIRVVFAVAKEDNLDASQVSLRLWPKKRPSVEIWYRAGGIHDFEEVVDSHDSLHVWLEACLDYYT